MTGECFAAKAFWALGYRTRRSHASSAPGRWPVRGAGRTRVIASYFAAHIHQLRGDAFSAQHHAEHALAVADDYGLSVWVALSRIIRGWARVEQGAVADGISELQHALDAYLATGARLGARNRRISCSGVDTSRTTRRRGGRHRRSARPHSRNGKTAPPRICIASRAISCWRSAPRWSRQAATRRSPRRRLPNGSRRPRVFQPRGHRRTGAAGQS